MGREIIKANRYYQILKHTPYKTETGAIHPEIIPFEILWEMVLELLKK